MTAPPARSPGRALLALAWIAVLVALLYGRTLEFGFTRTDDVELIEDQAEFLADPGNVPAAFGQRFFRGKHGGEVYYRPLMTLSLMLDARWDGVEPAAFHASSVAAHAVAGALLWRLLLRLGLAAPVALGAASLFVVHPALAQAVAWVPGRVDVLLAIFALASLLGYLRTLEGGGGAAWALHGAGLVLALFTKEAALALPPACAAAAWILGPRAALRHPAPWALWLAALALWALAWHAATGAGAPDVLLRRGRLLFENAPVLALHLGKLLLPTGLSVLAVVADAPRWPAALALGALLAAGAWTRGVARRRLLWGGVLFLAFSVPGLPVSDYLILENRLYLPAVGVAVALAAVAQQILDRGGRPAAVSLLASATLAGAGLALLTHRGVGDFASPEAFTRAAVAQSPSSALAHLNRGIVHHRRGDLDRAEQHYLEAIRLDPHKTVVHNNLGLVHLSRERDERAIREFLLELAVNPGYGSAWSNLGAALLRRGRPEAAELAFQEAAALDPGDARAREGLREARARRADPGPDAPRGGPAADPD